MSRFHHIWKVAEKSEHPSPQEQLAGTGRTFGAYLPWCFERDVIVTYRCETCGTEKVERV